MYAPALTTAAPRPPWLAAARRLQGYDPIQLSLAEALQLLATKNRWSSSKQAREAAVQQALSDQAPGAAAAAAEGAAAEAQGGSGKQRGRKKKAAPEPGTQPEALEQRLDADAEARVALDAAAALEISQLRAAMGEGRLPAAGQAGQEAYARAQATEQALKQRSPTAYLLFVRREWLGLLWGCCRAAPMLSSPKTQQVRPSPAARPACGAPRHPAHPALPRCAALCRPNGGGGARRRQVVGGSQRQEGAGGAVSQHEPRGAGAL